MEKEFEMFNQIQDVIKNAANTIEKLIEAKKERDKVKRDWQIECFTDGKRNWWRQPNGLYTNQIFERGLTESQLSIDKNIWAVRRLSDNEVFSVGDEVEDKLVKGKKNIIYFFVDGNDMLVGFMGHGRNIKDLSKLPQRTKGCNICGGELVLIRGRYPNEDKRQVCPTCNTERLEQINELSSNAYGVAMKESSIPPLKP